MLNHNNDQLYDTIAGVLLLLARNVPRAGP